MSRLSVTAVYDSPIESHTFILPSSESSASSSQPAQSNEASLSSDPQSEYLHSVRSSVSKLQAEINTFLTKKMEEDKGEVKAEDAQAEENYGEEVADDNEEVIENGSGIEGKGK
ncbi:MAG: hypothetical protein Q9157_006900 [Trypethelium eluteriae]